MVPVWLPQSPWLPPRQRGGTAPRSRVNHCQDRNQMVLTGSISPPVSPSVGRAKGRGPGASALCSWHPAHQIPPCLSFREFETSSPSPAPCAKPRSAGEWYWLGKTQRLNRVTGRDPASTGHSVAPVAIMPHPGSCLLRCANTPGPGIGQKEAPGTKSWLGLAQPRCREEPPGSPRSPCARPSTSRPSAASGTFSPADKEQAGRMLGGRQGKTPQPRAPTGTPSPRSDSPTPPRWDPPGPPAPCPSRCLVSRTSRSCSSSCERRSR